LKALHAAFSDAQSGAAPAPRWIDVGTGIPFVGFISGPTMKCWPEFKRDYRDTDFSEGARQKLDSIQARVGAYNGAMNAARDPAVHYVAASVDAAVAVLLESDDYKRWQHKQAAQRTNPVPMGHEPKSADDWYGYVDAMAASAVSSPTKQTVGRTIADVWFTNWPASAETATLGWLVGGRPDKAADHAWSKYPAGMLNPPPPLEWIILIFEDAWPAVERDPVFQAALDIAASLFAQVKDTEQDLEAGLRKIQKRYEGGEPLV
jgi:hypothetical protein